MSHSLIIDDFVRNTESFVTWIESPQEDKLEEASAALLHLSGIYASALQLMKVDVGKDEGSSDDPEDYKVTVEDVYGTRKTASIQIDEPRKISNQVVRIEGISASGRKDGYAEIDPIGGTPPYTILWGNGEKGAIAEKLNFGFTYVTITDANGCSIEETLKIPKPKLMPDLDIAKIKVGQTLQLNKLYFEADSSTITDVSYEVLDEVYEFMSQNNSVFIEIGGHTNNIPPDDYCDRLSTARAKAVADFLYDLGITEDRIAFKGYGKRNPIASNNSASGRRKNQRVEIKILRLGSD